MEVIERRKAFVSEHMLTVIIGLSVILALGTLARLYHLDYRSIGHVEMYAPNIPLPEGISDPPPRLSLIKTITGTLFDVHPPVWYIMMWPWTKFFGTSLFVLRFPSVIFGVGSILLIYLLGTILGDRKTGLIAAGLLAFNGHQIFWSQISRPFITSVFLGLAATILLLHIIRSGSRNWLPLILYLSISVIGLGTIYYYWPFFITQMIWVLIFSWQERHPDLGLFRWQSLVLLGCSPLITIAIFQSRESYLSNNILSFVADFIKFGFAFEPDVDAAIQPALPALLMLVVPILALVLFSIGSYVKLKTDRPAVNPKRTAPSMPLLAVMAGLTFVAMIGISLVLGNKVPIRTKPMLVSSVIPFLIFFSVLILNSSNPLVSKIRESISSLSALGKPWFLIILQATLPVLMIVTISLFIPFFASREAMTYTPYFLFMIAAGSAALIPANPRVKSAIPFAILLFGLAWVNLSGIQYNYSRPGSPVDYKSLSEQWRKQISPSDLILIQQHWANTPIFFYLNAKDYHFVGSNYAQVIQANPNSRVWVFKLDSLGIPAPIQNALVGFNEVEAVRAHRVEADLYERQVSVGLSSDKSSSVSQTK